MEEFGGQQHNQVANLGSIGVHSLFSASCSAKSVCQDPALWDLESSEPKRETSTMQEASRGIHQRGAEGGPKRIVARSIDSDYRDRSQGLSLLWEGKNDPERNLATWFDRPSR